MATTMDPARSPAATGSDPDEATPGAAADATSAVARSLDLLEMVMRAPYPPSAAQISEELKLPRPTANRIIGNLVRMRFLKRDPLQRRLIEGDRLLELALAVLARATQREPGHEILRELSRRTQETCNVGVMVGARVRYLDRVEAHWPLALRLEPGSDIPLHCTALGKLLLAHLPRAQRDRYLRSLELTRHTPHTITEAAALERELERIVAEGCSTDDEEYLPGVIGLAVAIPARESPALLGLAVAAPSARVSVDDLRGHLPLLRDFASRLAACY